MEMGACDGGGDARKSRREGEKGEKGDNHQAGGDDADEDEEPEAEVCCSIDDGVVPKDDALPASNSLCSSISSSSWPLSRCDAIPEPASVPMMLSVSISDPPRSVSVSISASALILAPPSVDIRGGEGDEDAWEAVAAFDP